MSHLGLLPRDAHLAPSHDYDGLFVLWLQVMTHELHWVNRRVIKCCSTLHIYMCALCWGAGAGHVCGSLFLTASSACAGGGGCKSCQHKCCHLERMCPFHLQEKHNLPDSPRPQQSSWPGETHCLLQMRLLDLYMRSATSTNRHAELNCLRLPFDFHITSLASDSKRVGAGRSQTRYPCQPCEKR